MVENNHLKPEIIATDVLCVGGGIAGMMAAIRAAETGVSVVLAEKGNTKRSGNGATGNDHFMRCYIPEVQGSDPNPVIDVVTQSRGWDLHAGLRPHLDAEDFRYRPPVGELGHPRETPRPL